ncbi:MAG TPA: adenylate/guanylate cyclase domain-containing protein [Gordonia sp. (in: high G+C Gram-positive bacteria)]|jgi:class 3 adenylate cyclase|nr:adenylate/guanylate cyclase domain-containing protein [Gordonia sp. (in: high G+C Gram-positive bacteria)]
MQRFAFGRQVTAFVLGTGEPAVDWGGLDVATRTRLAKRATAISILVIVVSNAAISVETFLLVQLAYNGGVLTVDSTIGAPNFPAIVAAVVVGLALNVLLGLAMLRPQMHWFRTGSLADHERRRAVQHVPYRQVAATVTAWFCAVGVYVLVADDVTAGRILGVTVAFTLAALSSGSLTFLFAERALRPLAVVALHDYPATHAMHGVRARMLAAWAVSSSVPLIGLIILNLGRGLDILPRPHGRIDWATVILAFVAVTAGSRVVSLVARSISDPLMELRQVLLRVDRGDFDARVAVYDSSEIGVLQHGFNELVMGLEERERVRDLFARHVGDTVAERAMSSGLGRSGTKADVGVLFVDIVGSTSMAEYKDPGETAELLNAFFTIVDEVVSRHNGMINKFEGDAALAVFGAPVEHPNPAAAALAAARELARQLRGELPIQWGIGVCYGTTFAGNIGSERRYEYTVIGDPVNECARLSDLAKTVNGSVLANASAVGEADGEARHWRSVGARVVRGREEPTELFMPVEFLPHDPPKISDVLTSILRPARRTLRL